MNLSVAELKKALRIREKTALSIRAKINKLDVKKIRLQKQLDEILGGKSVEGKAVRRKYRKRQKGRNVKAQRKGKRVRGKSGTLKESLIKVLTQAGKPLHLNDILKGLKDVGYKSGAKDIKKQVGVRLYTIKQFVKTAPGIFALKTMGAKAGKKASKKFAAPTKTVTFPVAAGKKTKKDLPF